MPGSRRSSCALAIVLASSLLTSACSFSASSGASSRTSSETALPYSWTKVTDSTALPGAYNFPVFVVRNQMWAFHPQGHWYSPDGKNWTKSELPLAGLNPGYQKYVQFNDAVYALGTMEGNYTNMRLGSRISRTIDLKRWEVLAEQSNLPARVFYGAFAFKGKIWLMGGFDGKQYYNDVWNSPDGVRWTRVTEHAGWSTRNIMAAVVFKERMWVIGGGLIDGTPPDGQTRDDVWSSTDGVTWTRVSNRMARIWGGSPVVYDGKLWLVGANRDGNFMRATLVTEDGTSWREQEAPWTPRGAPAVWVFDNKIYMTGGKYSVTENGEIKFIYSNDVWYMAASRT
jgi:hypothetical protein